MSSAPRWSEKQERLARVYDTEVWPIFGNRFAQMLLRGFEPRPASRVLELGCATGQLTALLAARLDAASRITALESAPALLAQAQQKLDAGGALAQRVTLATGGELPLGFADGSFHLAVANAGLPEAAAPEALAREVARVLRPGGQLVATLPLRGTWAEPLDIYREVLLETKRTESLAALERYVAEIPEGETVARWLEEAGFERVEVEVARWELLFRTAREFFFSPVIEMGPLTRWKQIAGRGDEMQDTFFFLKESIDAYFADSVFPVTVVAGCVKGRRPLPATLRP